MNAVENHEVFPFAGHPIRLHFSQITELVIQFDGVVCMASSLTEFPRLMRSHREENES